MTSISVSVIFNAICGIESSQRIILINEAPRSCPPVPRGGFMVSVSRHDADRLYIISMLRTAWRSYRRGDQREGRGRRERRIRGVKVEKREETPGGEADEKRDAGREKSCFWKRAGIEEDLLPVSRWKVSKEEKEKREKGGEPFPKM